MPNPTRTPPTRPHFLVASFGHEAADGGASISPIDLDQLNASDEITALCHEVDMVFVLGDCAQCAVPTAAVTLAEQCQQNGIPCFAVLRGASLDTQKNETASLLCQYASSVLILGDSENVQCEMRTVVSSIVAPLQNQGMIGIDLDDIKTIFSRGKNIQLAMASSNDVKTVADTAICQLSDVDSVIAVYGSINHGSSFSTDEYNAILETINKTFSNDCVVALSTTHNRNQADELQLTLLAIKK